MDNKEIVRKFYRNLGIEIDDNSINSILKDNKRTSKIIRLYENEELKSMNYILNKPEDNKYFARDELEALNKIDLMDKKVVEVARNIVMNGKRSEFYG